MQDLRKNARRNLILDWGLIWVALTLAGGLTFPVPIEAARLQVDIWLSAMGISAGIVFLMAATLRLFAVISHLKFYAQAALGGLVVAALYEPFLRSFAGNNEATSHLMELRNFIIIFGLCVICYLWRWYRSAARDEPSAENKPYQTPNIDGLLHVDQQSDRLCVHTKEGVEMWDIPFDQAQASLAVLAGSFTNERHWVADHSVMGMGLNRMGQLVLYLCDESFVHVAESYKSEIGFRYRNVEMGLGG